MTNQEATLTKWIIHVPFACYVQALVFALCEDSHPHSEDTGLRARGEIFCAHGGVSALSCCLDPTALKTTLVVIYYPNDFKDRLECAVCISEVSQGEKTRFLPKCKHGFHMDCIDMRFQSHSTCPLFRALIRNANESSSNPSSPKETVIQTPIEENSSQPPNFPTIVLFWGNETQVSTFGPCLEDSHQGIATAAPFQPTSSSSLASTSNRPNARD
ncbi:unnamed protein product [Fraxinus pennsylvanica]|uniref:RING-type domain-containing protein n=1 Tax=Fraxinus pennsylvanica TaxID=56036 RepID=A0AAD1YUQ1_9LAMI|nr:unnamed protein product [Fraxinus pennsylvanica]